MTLNYKLILRKSAKNYREAGSIKIKQVFTLNGTVRTTKYQQMLLNFSFTRVLLIKNALGTKP